MKTTSQKNTAKGVFNEKTIKQTVPYNWKKFLAGVMFMLVAVPVFTSCEKDPETNNNNNNQTPTQQRTEEFIYNTNLDFYRNGSSEMIPYTAFGDTAAKYGNDGNVKQIHVTPETPHMCDNYNETKMQTRANIFDGIYAKSKNKLSGENTTLYLDSAALSNQTVQQVLHNKLKITLLQK